MEILAVIGIVATFALVCAAIYRVGRSLQRTGHDLNFVDPRYPDSMQAAPGNRDVTPPGRPNPDDDTSLFLDDEENPPGQDRHETA
ncbi:MAG: hypothetical protein QOG14_2918 [Mycobacterium sp.]|jgi:hypothetical protein|nr:hypothetical protein [Mycobacterium sp.]